MAKSFPIKKFPDLENAESEQELSENYPVPAVEPRMSPLGQGTVDELTLWAIAKQLENEEKKPKSR